MAETPQSYVEAPKTVDNKPTDGKQDITIESVLQKKFPDNPEKQQLFKDVFQQPDFVSLPPTTTDDSLSQQDILAYLQNGNLKGDVRKLSIGVDISERTEIMLRNINAYFKATTGKEKNIKTYNEETQAEKEDNNINNEVQTENNEVQTESNEVQTKNNEKKEDKAEAERLNAEYTQFLKTKESFKNLPENKKIQVTNENKKDIPQEIITNAEKKIQAIKENSPKAEISVNDYLSFYLTAQQEELQGTDFHKNFEELNIMRGTVVTLEEAAKPRNAYLIAGHNESCSAYLGESEDLNNINKPNLPETENFEDEFNTYVKFIPDQSIREEIQRRKGELMEYNQMLNKDSDTAIRMKEGETGKFSDIYQEQIDNVKNNIPGKAKDITKQSILGSCITGVAKYFDSSSEETNKKGFEKKLKLHTQDSISIDKGEEAENEKGDNILYIQKEIDGKNIGYYYNLDDGNAALKSKDAIGENEDGSFTLSEGGGKSTLNYINLPTIAFLTNQAQNSINNDVAQVLKDAKNMEEFEILLNKTINDKLSMEYDKESMREPVIEKDIEKNITAQSLQDEFMPNAVLTELNKEGKSINKITDKELRKILEIWDTSTEGMSFSDLRRLRTVMGDLDPLIAKEEHPNLENNMSKLLENFQKDRDAKSYTQDWGKGTLKFFKIFSKDDMINIDDLKKFKNILQKKETVSEHLSSFSLEFQEQYESLTLEEDILQLENHDLRNETPIA